MSASEQSVLVAESQISSGSDGCWSEAVSKGEIRCLQTVGEQLFSGSTNVRVWDLRTGLNTHSIPMKPRTSVKDMVLQQQEGRTSVWCAHSDGRVSEIVVDPGSFEPELDRQFSAHRSAVSTILVTPELEIWTGSSRGTIRCWSIEEIASAPPVRTTKLGCPFYEPMVAVELEWQGSRGSDVRCLLSVPSEGTVWSGSSGKGGTHVWDAASHAHLEVLPEGAGNHLVCAAVVHLDGVAGPAAEGGGGAVPPESGLTVWTGHTDGRVAQWNPKRSGAEPIRGPWIAHTDGRWVTGIQSARDGQAVVVWIGFEDGLMIAYDASTAAVLRKCKAHHSGIAAMSSFSARPVSGGVIQKLATASTKGTLRSWNAVDCAPAAARAAGGGGGAARAERPPRPALGRGLYGGVEYVEYKTPARHAFGRRCSMHSPTDQAVLNPDEAVTVDVTLHVYDLGVAAESKGFRALKAINTQALGAFHVAVEIFGWEWSFGWNDDGSTGVFSGLPAMCDMHTYREKVSLGFTTLSRAQVDKKLARLEDEWMGDDYDMLDRNCCHYCNSLCHELGVGELPKWVNRAAGAGSAIAGGIESLVSLKQNFRRSKAVTATQGGGGMDDEEDAFEPAPAGGGM